MTTTPIVSRTTQFGVQHYLRQGLWGGGLAAVINVAIYVVGKALSNLPFLVPMQGGAEPTSLPVFMVVLMSAVPGVLAAGVLYGLNRFIRQGFRIFAGVAAVFALLSLVGPLSLPIDSGTKVALASMHLVAAASIVGMLSVLVTRPQPGVVHG